MHKRSLLFDVQQDGASPGGEGICPSASGRRQACYALVKMEPVPPWLALFNQSVVKK